MLSIAPIGTIPTPEQMEAPVKPVTFAAYDDAVDGIASCSVWTTFRGNAGRTSSAPCDIPTEVNVAWRRRIVRKTRDGTVRRDWRSYLNSRLTAAAIAGGAALLGDIDQNEIIALRMKDGTVLWRFLTGGRVDSPPTLYKGICLVGDHTGYVYALKIKNGQLLYKLRIAPQEKRMVSYGKVESVWPVIGGVMVADGKAYASAGRTQGSDGGLVIRAFVPETGSLIWSKALPQGGKDLIKKKPARNDCLTRDGDFLTVMGHWLELDTGKICPKPGGKDKKRRTVVVGLEGLYSWNWTRLGHRKFIHIGYGEFTGDTVSWNDTYVATTRRGGGRIVPLAEPQKARPLPPAPPYYQATCVVLCRNVVLVAGGLLDQAKDHGFIRAVDLGDGHLVWEKKFDAKLAFNGLAVDDRGIVASLDDGSVACLR